MVTTNSAGLVQKAVLFVYDANNLRIVKSVQDGSRALTGYETWGHDGQSVLWGDLQTISQIQGTFLDSACWSEWQTLVSAIHLRQVTQEVEGLVEFHDLHTALASVAIALLQQHQLIEIG